MRKIFFVLLLVTISVQGIAQRNGRRFERIHAIKVSYITDRLQLSSEQAERFWPIYNQYEEELRSIRQDFIKKYGKDLKPDNEEQSTQYIDDNLDYQQQMLDLRKKYKEKFLKVISPQQLASLIEAERSFKKMLLKRLRQRMNDRDD